MPVIPQAIPLLGLQSIAPTCKFRYVTSGVSIQTLHHDANTGKKPIVGMMPHFKARNLKYWL